MFIPTVINEYSEAFKKENLLPNEFIESIEKVKQAIKSAEEEDKQQNDENQS